MITKSTLAEQMLTAQSGATMDEIIAATGGPQYNVLRILRGAGPGGHPGGPVPGRTPGPAPPAGATSQRPPPCATAHKPPSSRCPACLREWQGAVALAAEAGAGAGVEEVERRQVHVNPGSLALPEGGPGIHPRHDRRRQRGTGRDC